MKTIFILLMFCFCSATYCIDLPKEIIGTWQVNAEKTFELFKAQPGFESFPKDKIDQLKKYFSQMKYKIENDQLTILGPDFKPINEKVEKVVIKEKTITLTSKNNFVISITIIDVKNIVITSPKKNSISFVLFK